MKVIRKNKLFWILAMLLLIIITAVIICHFVSIRVIYHVRLLPNGTIELLKIDNFKGDTLEIPDKIRNLPVTSISNMAISMSDIDYDEIKHLILPNYVRTLQNDTFSNLTQLEDVTIGNGLEEFNARAFKNVNSFTIKKAEGNKRFSIVENCLLGSSGNYVELCYGDHIPYGVEIIGDYALAYRPIETITIPETVMSIGKYAFAECNNLTAINIPENVRYILDCAFYNCPNLENVIISDGILSIGEYAFLQCEKLSSISLPDSLLTVGRGAFSATALTDVPYMGSVTELPLAVFSGCDNMVSIHIPEGIQIIGADAFRICDNLEAVTFPSTLRIFESAIMFVGCDRLAELNIANDNLNYYSSGNCLVDRQTLSVVSASNGAVIPSGVKAIADSAFSEHRVLPYISIPDGVERIEHNAFVYCHGLQALYIPASVTMTENRIIGGNGEPVHIYCGAEAQPEAWDENWNSDGYPVTWGVSREQFEDIIK